jgi:hypothetical protein
MLTNGKVLVAGGYNGPAQASAESYDPMANTWVSAASMVAARGSFTATLLASGKVIVTGGDNGSALASAEIYDPLPIGALCGVSGDCLSGFCVDGVCCDTSCTDLCVACTAAKKSSGSDGTCGNVAPGTNPDNECATQGASTCLQNGFCNGSGACQVYANGTVCVAAFCSGAVLNKADLCNGGGSCVDSGTQDCAPYACSGGACLTTCFNDTHCAATAYCTGSTCTSKKGLGTACGGTNECQSGFCVDGVCCNNACTAFCAACSAAKKGAPPDGTCGNIAPGADPDDECTAQGASTCLQDGFCNGSGACQVYANGTVCVAPSCSGSILNKADLCNGYGSCVDSGTQDCTPYACSGNACLTTCSNDSQCAATAYCAGSTCTTKKGPGVSCGGTQQCQSGFCVDAVCCDKACSEICTACSALAKGAGIDGTCEQVQAGGDPHNDCTDQGSGSCGTDGACNGEGECRKYVDECDAGAEAGPDGGHEAPDGGEPATEFSFYGCSTSPRLRGNGASDLLALGGLLVLIVSHAARRRRRAFHGSFMASGVYRQRPDPPSPARSAARAARADQSRSPRPWATPWSR